MTALQPSCEGWQFNYFVSGNQILTLYILSCFGYIRKRSVKQRWDGVDWIDMAQDRDQWRALVNTVLNLQVP
jgi:hypothetical protein